MKILLVLVAMNSLPNHAYAATYWLYPGQVDTGDPATLACTAVDPTAWSWDQAGLNAIINLHEGAHIGRYRSLTKFLNNGVNDHTLVVQLWNGMANTDNSVRFDEIQSYLEMEAYLSEICSPTVSYNFILTSGAIKLFLGNYYITLTLAKTPANWAVDSTAPTALLQRLRQIRIQAIGIFPELGDRNSDFYLPTIPQ